MSVESKCNNDDNKKNNRKKVTTPSQEIDLFNYTHPLSNLQFVPVVLVQFRILQ